MPCVRQQPRHADHRDRAITVGDKVRMKGLKSEGRVEGLDGKMAT
jgi:hypothetical protein